jgi:hypothetical protein
MPNSTGVSSGSVQRSPKLTLLNTGLANNLKLVAVNAIGTLIAITLSGVTIDANILVTVSDFLLIKDIINIL